MKLERLNLGCGRDYREGYMNLDISPDVRPDVVSNIEECIPFRDGTFDEILANNVLTQILKPRVFLRVINELWRIAKKGGEINIRVPVVTDVCAWQDPMDCRRFTDQSFTYMQHDHRRYEQYGKHYGFKPFSVQIISNNGNQMEVKLKPIK